MHSFLNFLKKNKLYTAINITGLTVSMAFVLLLACYVTKQLRTDNFQQNADRIYVVASDRQYESAYYLQAYLKQRYPEIETSTAFVSSESMEIRSGENMVLGTLGIADTSFFAIACLLTLTVSTLTVLWQSIRAADTSPVDALRKE